ncbi:MAG: ABC transporter ATP-binding protein [Janthinobacterium lividum]
MTNRRATSASPAHAEFREPAPASADSGIRFEAVSVAYGATTVLDSLDLAIESGQIVALIGPSGSGKSTILRALAGFATPARGRLFIGRRDVTRLAPAERHIGMVVQNYALFPHLRVADNVAFGLRARGVDARQIREQVPEDLRRVGMARHAGRYPHELSGGEQQRVALARALAIRPRVLLLDEPLSALDPQTRHAMLDELAALHRDLPALTILYVTHDQTEALRLADAIGVMRAGRLVAFDRTARLYRHPPNRFVAEFLGQANVLPGTSLRVIRTGQAAVRVGTALLQGHNPHGVPEHADCLVCVRPHAVRLGAGAAHDNHLSGVVRDVTWLGDMHRVTLDVAGHRVDLNAPLRCVLPAPGSVVAVHFAADDVTLVPETAP